MTAIDNTPFPDCDNCRGTVVGSIFGEAASVECERCGKEFPGLARLVADNVRLTRELENAQAKLRHANNTLFASGRAFGDKAREQRLLEEEIAIWRQSFRELLQVVLESSPAGVEHVARGLSARLSTPAIGSSVHPDSGFAPDEKA